MNQLRYDSVKFLACYNTNSSTSRHDIPAQLLRMSANIVVAVFLCVAFCEAAVYYYSPTNATNDAFYTRMNSLAAGDVMVFLAGTYTLGGRLGPSFAGTDAAKITIKGEDGKRVIFNRPNANQNIVDFTGSNFVIQNIEFTGGSKGIRLGTSGATVNNVLLYNLTIHDTAETAITCNDDSSVCNNLVVRNVEIYNTGTGTGECLYFGCQDNKCRTTNSLVENCYCHDTLQATSGSVGSGFQIKTGSYNNVVRNSVCARTGGPCVLMYDDYDQGVNTIEGNLSIDSNDAGFQFTAGVIVRNNIVVNSKLGGIFGSTNQVKSGSNPRNIQVLHNTVYGSSSDYCLRGNTWTGANIIVANNALFCEGKAGSFQVLSNQVKVWANNGYIGGSAPPGATGNGAFVLGSITTELQDPSKNNFYPKSTSKLVSSPGGNSTYTTSYDYNCNARSTSSVTIGAYQYQQATNPGAAAVAGYKTCVTPNTPTTTPSSATVTVVSMLTFFVLLLTL